VSLLDKFAKITKTPLYETQIARGELTGRDDKMTLSMKQFLRVMRGSEFRPLFSSLRKLYPIYKSFVGASRQQKT
jgi:hypothetical protein